MMTVPTVARLVSKLAVKTVFERGWQLDDEMGTTTVVKKESLWVQQMARKMAMMREKS